MEKNLSLQFLSRLKTKETLDNKNNMSFFFKRNKRINKLINEIKSHKFIITINNNDDDDDNKKYLNIKVSLYKE